MIRPRFPFFFSDTCDLQKNQEKFSFTDKKWTVTRISGTTTRNPKYVGADFGKLYDKNKDESKRKLFLVELCEGAKNPYGVWGEYYWEKLGSTEPARKISFMVQVPGQPYQITSGIYDDQTTLEELNGTVHK